MMVERTPGFNITAYIVLALGIIITAFPLYYAFTTATHSIQTVASGRVPLIPGRKLLDNVAAAWETGNLARSALNTTIVSLLIVAGKLALSTMTAFALVYFELPLKRLMFWMVFVTLMLPVEVRIAPTYQIAANALEPFQILLDILGISWLLRQTLGVELSLKWNLLNSYAGLSLPLLASATGTFLFRQFFMTLPSELAEAAQIDGAGPMRFFFRILLPLSRTNLAALATIMFVYGWNQYLWPLLVTTQKHMSTLAIALVRLSPQFDDLPTWNHTMAGVLLALIPPVLVVLGMQRLFVKGLVNSPH